MHGLHEQLAWDAIYTTAAAAAAAVTLHSVRNKSRSATVAQSVTGTHVHLTARRRGQVTFLRSRSVAHSVRPATKSSTNRPQKCKHVSYDEQYKLITGQLAIQQKTVRGQAQPDQHCPFKNVLNVTVTTLLYIDVASPAMGHCGTWLPHPDDFQQTV